jgi:hypothetical protein
VGLPILTDEDAYEIRILRNLTRCSQQEIADEYGVSRQAVAGILRGRSFKNAGGPLEQPGSFQASRIGPNPTHGRSYWYVSRGCRCDLCARWNADKAKEWRRRNGK